MGRWISRRSRQPQYWKYFEVLRTSYGSQAVPCATTVLLLLPQPYLPYWLFTRRQQQEREREQKALEIDSFENGCCNDDDDNDRY
jgi:hypothetical protein